MCRSKTYNLQVLLQAVAQPGTFSASSASQSVGSLALLSMLQSATGEVSAAANPGSPQARNTLPSRYSTHDSTDPYESR